MTLPQQETVARHDLKKANVIYVGAWRIPQVA